MWSNQTTYLPQVNYTLHFILKCKKFHGEITTIDQRARVGISFRRCKVAPQRHSQNARSRLTLPEALGPANSCRSKFQTADQSKVSPAEIWNVSGAGVSKCHGPGLWLFSDRQFHLTKKNQSRFNGRASPPDSFSCRDMKMTWQLALDSQQTCGSP